MEIDEIYEMINKISGPAKDNLRLREYGSAHYRKEQERQTWNPPGLKWSDSSETGMSGD